MDALHTEKYRRMTFVQFAVFLLFIIGIEENITFSFMISLLYLNIFQ